MEDLGENTTVLSTLRSLNNFISQRVEGGSGLDVSTSAQGSLQMQYQQSMQLEERAEQIRSRSHLIQVEREKTQMELSHKRARVELERAASASARSYEREVDRNQELLTRIRQLQEREAEAEGKMKEQLQRYRLCQQSLDAASKRLRDQEDGLAEAGETVSVLKGRLSDLQWSVMNQEMQVKRLESERQELKEQLELQHRKWQEANQKVQELQASQEARVGQEQRIKDLEQKLTLQEQDAAVVKSMRSELARLPAVETELRQLREENACLREMRDTNGLLREELEGLQRRLGRQEKMQEALVELELEKERLLTKLQSWERLDQTTGLSIRTPEDLSRFIVELQQRELTLKDRNSSITSSARGLEQARLRLQQEVRQLGSQLLEERKKREVHEALARRLQRRVLLLTKVRAAAAVSTPHPLPCVSRHSSFLGSGLADLDASLAGGPTGETPGLHWFTGTDPPPGALVYRAAPQRGRISPTPQGPRPRGRPGCRFLVGAEHVRPPPPTPALGGPVGSHGSSRVVCVLPARGTSRAAAVGSRGSSLGTELHARPAAQRAGATEGRCAPCFRSLCPGDLGVRAQSEA
ncbi:PREDICTED: mitotic spindle assembly checkpoint protein MAD1 [Lipotes vexillifer]|uniref:Mitotic spindle assembly checkpoint protein MAD1 n=1 Tax=Lipotes vexillifer TaxID=118797 RepID=A0A340Y7K2_LIPVE|nr:PREDICTED: mitotic spindle assembly checkpoint protein MAD1 [Lipotes vexillifer]